MSESRDCLGCRRPMFRDELLRCSICVSIGVRRLARLLNVEASYDAYQRYARWRQDQLAIR